MNRKYLISGSAAIAVLIAIIFIFRSCSHRKIEIDPGFSEYIAAFTSGNISVQSNIRVELTKEVEAVQVNSEVDKKVFSFSPGIDGKAYWIDNHTIEFRPEKPLKQGKQYVADFYLSKLLKVPKKFRTFVFDFVTMKQAVSMQVEGYQPYILTSLKWNNVTGTIVTADLAEDASVEKILTATQSKNKLKINWTHNNETKTHHFKVDSIVRGEDSTKVNIEWKGSPIGADNSGIEEVKIPSIYDFSALEANVEQEPNQYVAIRFSDPIEPKQDLNGLITLGNGSGLTFEIDHMLVKVYPSARQSGTVSVNVEQGIKNIAGAKLKKKQSFEVVFESIKPAIKEVGKGVILPDSKGLIFPFQAVNLKAVDLRIIKIFENNVSQFLQVNQLDGTSELKRAGRLILKKTIRLDSEKPINYNKWNYFSIDLTKLIKQDPGAIYRIQLSFKKEYSTYPCSGEAKDDKSSMSTVQEENEDNEGETGYWDTPDRSYSENYYEEYEDSYNWSEREDPCSASYYYGSQATISRNLLASNLGIIAKGTSDNTILVAVSNLVTTKPMSGVEIEVYDYQRQKMATAKTDNNGFCNISLKNKPFLLIAKDGDQRGYLRIDDGTALSLSNFDVSGETIQKGLKGFMYGERGVWRPGDTVFLTFILEDVLKKLPANHPVVLEVINPQGQLFKRIVKTTGVNGFYQFNFNTNESDPTGNWVAYIKIGGTTFSKTLKIETIKPNRLKILFDFGTELLKGSSQKGTLNVKWLHGAPAKNLRANVAVTLSAASTNFKGYDSYDFDDPAKKYHTEEETIFDKELDENGNATVTAGISVNRNAPGMLRANFVTRVFEPGGEFSTDRFNTQYSPYSSYVGIKPPDNQFGWLFTDTAQAFDLVTLSPDGKPVNRKNLEFSMYKMEWRYWWDSNSESELANFIGSTYTKPVFTKNVSTVGGKAKVNYRLNYPDWGRFYVRVTDNESGHSTGKVLYFDWPGWRGRADRGDSKGATMLSFSADKKSYKVGEKATLTVPSSQGGRMLVSIETGSEIVKVWWVETTAKETKATFDITEKMAPNIYIHVSLIQPHAQTQNDLPIRMYGVIPASVENPATHITPVINMPDVLEPEKAFTVKVSEKNNHAMTYTLAIVDEGLLDLTRFKTPDPWTSFYGREALGVKTWDLYDQVMGAFGGKIESLFAIGGDASEKKGSGSEKANRFKPIVKVLGPFSLKSGTNKHEITLPQYVGSVRVMVVAGENEAFGREEKTVPVRMPLMALATLPRVLGPGEEVNLPVTVFAMDKKIKEFTVEVFPNEYLQLIDSKSKKITVKQPGEFDLAFNLKVASKEGVGKVKVRASSGDVKSEFDIEINIRNPNSKMVKVSEAMVEAGKTADIDYTLIGIQGTNKATLEASSIPPIDLSRRLRYLLEYPYGCVEQTTSAAFPQLYLDKFIELDDNAKQRRDNNIKYAINRINSMVVSDGGIGYWPGSVSSCDWGSTYAGHFLLEAEKLGYNLPSGFKKNWLNYQRKQARNWSVPSKVTYEYARFDLQLEQSYRLYTLALAGEPEMGAMNRMKEMPNLYAAAAWRLAAAYALVKQVDVAKQIISRQLPEIKTYYWFNETYGSSERDLAMELETLSLLNDKTQAFAYMKKVASALASTYWLSTQTTAYSLLAISKFLDTEKTSKEIKFTYSGGGKTNVKVSTKVPLIQIELNARGPGAGKINIDNTGSGLVFIRIVTEGIPETGPQNEIENNLRMEVSFNNTDGKAIDISKITQGTDFVAEVTIWNTYRNGALTNMALRQVFPSGWEISNTRLDKEGVPEPDNNQNLFTYQDFRDDRVLTFFDMSYQASKHFTVHLNASYTGKFYFPGTLCEAMYEPTVNAFKPGKWVEVVKP